MLIIAFSLLTEYGIMLFRKKFGEYSCIFQFGIILRYIWFHKMFMKYGGMMYVHDVFTKHSIKYGKHYRQIYLF